MTDISDVATALAFRIASIVYPNGITGASITGRRTIVRRGWFTNSDLTGACSLAKGVDYIYVVPLSSGWKEIPSPLGMPWYQGDVAASTVSVATSGNTATIVLQTGVEPSGIVGLMLEPDNSGLIPDHSVAAYAVTSADTAASIAAALAALIPNATTAGAVITVPNAVEVTARTAGYAEAVRITRRQQQLFQVSIWCGSWKARDTLGAAVDEALSGDIFITASDGAKLLTEYAGGGDTDTMQTVSVFRRDLRYRITFDTTQKRTVAQMLFGIGVLELPGPVYRSFGDVPPVSGAETNETGIYEDAAGNIIFQTSPAYPGLAIDGAGNVVSSSS